MHSAPSVSYPMGQPRVVRRGLWGVWCCGAACAMAATAARDAVGWSALVLFFSVLLAFVVLRRSLRRASADAGLLHFDGQGWSLVGDFPSCEGKVEVCLDFQSSMLLSLREPGHPRRWLWSARADLPARWNDLRRAVYSRAATARAGTAGAAISPTPGASSTHS
jgi:toxin CptA